MQQMNQMVRIIIKNKFNVIKEVMQIVEFVIKMEHSFYTITIIIWLLVDCLSMLQILNV